MIAIIPARGGSKGLPGKNIKLLNGKALIGYTIEAALKSKYISRVIVSTDDIEIAEVARFYGAEIPFMRPDFLSTDHVQSIDVFKYTIEKIEEIEKIVIKEYIVLQPTSPLRTATHIDHAIELFLEKNADSVISYCKENHSIFWHKFISSDLKITDIFNENFNINRQQIPETFYPNGAIYIFKTFLNYENNYITKKSFAFLMEHRYSVDIDTLDDFEYVEFILNRLLQL